MKWIEFKQDWDVHTSHTFILININNDVVCSYQIEYYNGFKKLQAVYVQEKYRGRGFSKLILDRIKDDKDEIYLMVRKDNFIINTYKKYGFKKTETTTINKIKYIWMKKINKKL